MVRQALLRLLPDQATPAAKTPAAAAERRPVVDAQTISNTSPNSRLELPPNALVTPLARDLALERGVELAAGRAAPQVAGNAGRSIAIGADHGGFELKEQLKPMLVQLGWQPVDCGTFSKDSVDYPDYAYAVARLVSEGRVQWGVIIDGAGIGSCMVANKVPGVRAALCYDLSSAANSREHNHANVLTLGAGLVGTNLAQQIVKTWLDTPFGAGRHARRVEKITAIERRFAKG